MTALDDMTIAAGGRLPRLILASLRFNASASAALTRTFTSQATHSGSVWIKRGKLGAIQNIFGSTIYFNAADQLVINGLTSTAVFRDVSGWYRLHWNSTGAYVNGQLLTGTGTYATASLVNPQVGGPTNFFDGRLADFMFGDGQDWPVTSPAIPNLAGDGEDPASLSGMSFGAEGFWLDFLDPTSPTTLGYDVSGNGNHFTPANIVVADQLPDTPTDDTLNAVGNFAQLNPDHQWDDGTYSNANLTVVTASPGYYRTPIASLAADAGKFYFETLVNNLGGSTDLAIGVDDGKTEHGRSGPTDNTSTTDGNLIAYRNNGDIWHGSVATAYGATFTVADLIGVALDLDAGTIEFFKNNVSQGVLALTTTGIPYFPCARTDTTGGDLDFNFGQDAFTYTPPVGFVELSTHNLAAEPAAATKTGSFVGVADVDGPEIWLGYTPDTAGTCTINGNAITWGTHARARAGGFKVITGDVNYNAVGSNSYSIDVLGGVSGVDGAAQARAQF